MSSSSASYAIEQAREMRIIPYVPARPIGYSQAVDPAPTYDGRCIACDGRGWRISDGGACPICTGTGRFPQVHAEPSSYSTACMAADWTREETAMLLECVEQSGTLLWAWRRYHNRGGRRTFQAVQDRIRHCGFKLGLDAEWDGDGE